MAARRKQSPPALTFTLKLETLMDLSDWKDLWDTTYMASCRRSTFLPSWIVTDIAHKFKSSRTCTVSFQTADTMPATSFDFTYATLQRPCTLWSLIGFPILLSAEYAALSPWISVMYWWQTQVLCVPESSVSRRLNLARFITTLMMATMDLCPL